MRLKLDERESTPEQLSNNQQVKLLPNTDDF